MLRIALWVAVACASGCLRDNLVDCGDGRVCPVGTVCDDIHLSCATPEQLAACVGAEEGSDCVAGALTGACFDGVCIARGCGNRVVEANEQCDDGNQLSGDGCRNDCVSNERCGNGVADVGERCEDANLLSGDGCNSTCGPEAPSWAVHPVLPLKTPNEQRVGAFDEMRGRFVRATPYVTWEWDGTAWSGTAVTIPRRAVAVYYDADRGRVQAIEAATLGLWEWDGAAWTTRAASGTPSSIGGAIATYDRANQRAVVIDSQAPAAWTIDLAGTWTTLALPAQLDFSGPAYTSPIAYDAEAGTVIVLIGSEMWELDGTAWTSSSHSELPIESGGALVFHNARGHLWVIGGSDIFASRREVYEKVAGAWTLVTTAQFPTNANLLDVGYDNQRDVVIVGGGFLSGGRPHGEVLEWSNDAWTPVVPNAVPAFSQGLAPDPLRERIVSFGGGPANGVIPPTDETWIWTDRWSLLATAVSPPPRSHAAAAYDPIRGGVVITGGLPPAFGPARTDTWLLVGDSWTQIANNSPLGASSLCFDPEAQRLLLTTTNNGALWELPSSATSWSKVMDLDLGGDFVNSIAWNARAHVATMTTFGGDVYDFDGTKVVKTLSPGDEFRAFGDDRAGVVNLVPSSDLSTTIWQRRGTSWQSLDDLPAPMVGNGTYDASTARTLLLGRVGVSLVTFVRKTLSETPLETCTATDDADGDTLAGCDDPDCYWSCAPACPPFASCP